MKTILVPTDFSSTANNAARYAANFANTVKADKIILYNAYAITIATEMTWALMESDDLKHASEAGLEESRMVLRPFCDAGISIETMADFGFFGQRISDVATEVNADLIIMGITGSGRFEQAIFGSNALTAVHSTKLPLLIVPPDAVWGGIEKIAWACDYHNIKETTPLHVIESMLQETMAQLHVVYSDKNYNEFNPEIIGENVYLHEFFKSKPFQFSLLQGHNLSESVNKYVFENDIDWLIVVPKKHGWLESLFSKSHTKELAFHTHIPMLCLQQ